MLVTLLAFMLVGCTSTEPQRPPSTTEQKFFDIQTNRVPVVTAVNRAEGTNVVVTYTTNIVEQYVMKPNAVAQETAATAGTVGNLITPGAGGLVGTLVGGIFGIWGALRSRRSNQMSAALAQIIETGQQVLLTAPNGAELASQWKTWMVKHQAETGTIADISKLVANIVDTEDARSAASRITEIIRVLHQQPSAKPSVSA